MSTAKAVNSVSSLHKRWGFQLIQLLRYLQSFACKSIQRFYGSSHGPHMLRVWGKCGAPHFRLTQATLSLSWLGWSPGSSKAGPMMPPLPPIGERSVRKRVLDVCQPWLADPLALSSSGFLENNFRFGTILNWPRDSPPKKFDISGNWKPAIGSWTGQV